MTLLSIQTEVVARITAARIGSALRFALMDAADAVSRAIEAEEREARARGQITRQQIMDARTPAGGWTKAQLAAWGVDWPPPAGWIDLITADPQNQAEKETAE